jgi:hypothetical protein
MLYNDAWRPVLGKTKHPPGLGRPAIESWPEIWDIIGPQFTSVLTKGEATWSDDLLLVVERNDYCEEACFTYSYSPIKHSDGSIGGVFSAITETTERVLGERRLRILRELAAQTAESKSVQAACEAFARVLGAGNPDLPFAILYVLDEDRTFASLLAKTELDDAFAPAAVRLEHEYAFAAELDPAWAAKPLAITRHVRQPIEIGQFLRLSVALSGAIGQLHGLELIHKDRRT